MSVTTTLVFRRAGVDFFGGVLAASDFASTGLAAAVAVSTAASFVSTVSALCFFSVGLEFRVLRTGRFAADLAADIFVFVVFGSSTGLFSITDGFASSTGLFSVSDLFSDSVGLASTVAAGLLSTDPVRSASAVDFGASTLAG